MTPQEELSALLDVHRDFDASFEALARALLTRWELVAGGVAHRLIELEIYYYGGAHLDPFAHRHALQKTPGRWYFHRQGESYRGGTFKGLDLTFGRDAFGGVLIRSARSDALIDGPNRLVNHLLRVAGCTSVADLDSRLGDAFDSSTPLYLRHADAA